MKKILICTLLILFSFGVAVSNVDAYPYVEVEGFVKSALGTITDNLDGTSTISQVDYLFRVIGADFGAEMNYLSLEYEDEVFLSMGALVNLDPADWAVTNPPLTSSITGSTYQIVSAGTTIGVNETLEFSVLNVVMYNDAFTDPTLWQEGQVWAQSWMANDTLGGGDGGSTSVVPEPGTIFLLGTGLIAAGYYVRRRKN